MRIDLYCFPSKLERQPSKCQNFEAQSHSLFSRCLRLATTITGSHPRLATGGWLDLTRQAFHLLDYSPLSGRTIPICLSLPASSQHQTSQQQYRENDSCEDSKSQIISQAAGDEAYQGRTAGAAQVSGQRKHSEQ